MLGEYNLLEVDNRIILPIQTEFRLLVTSSDLKFKMRGCWFVGVDNLTAALHVVQLPLSPPFPTSSTPV